MSRARSSGRYARAECWISSANGGLMVALTGTERLADDIHLLAHHEVSGKSNLQLRAIGLGLAGGLLAEMALIRAIRVSGDGVAATERVRPPDRLMRAVHGQILGERQRHCTGGWLTFRAQTAANDVARRLAHSGYLTLTQSRRPWQASRWVPVDADCAFAPLIRVRARAARQRARRTTGPTGAAGRRSTAASRRRSRGTGSSACCPTAGRSARSAARTRPP